MDFAFTRDEDLLSFSRAFVVLSKSVGCYAKTQPVPSSSLTDAGKILSSKVEFCPTFIASTRARRERNFST